LPPTSLVLLPLLRSLWKQSACTLQLLLGASWKVQNFHITVTTGSPLESRVRAHCSWCCGLSWKQCTYTLQLILGPMKAEYWHISVDVWDPFASRALTHYSCCWEPPWKQSTCTLQLLFGAPLKAEYLHTTVAVEGLFEIRGLSFDLLRSIFYDLIIGNDRGPGPGRGLSFAPAGAIKIIILGRGPQIAVFVLVFSTEFYFLHFFAIFNPLGQW